MEDAGPSIEDYLDIVRRRKMLFIFTVPLLLFISMAVTMILPPIFSANGVILIQGQEIPEDLVKSTVQDFAEQQIEITRQKITTTARVMEVINKHSLYPSLRGSASNARLTENFREAMSIEMIDAEVPGQWGSQRANVAFIVSFMDKDPVKAQLVASELTTQFLEENVKARNNKADETANFLREEADRMQVRVQETENKIAEFKLAYGDSLPELLPFNLTAIDRLETQTIATSEEAIRLSGQIHNLNIELSNVSPFVQYSSGSGQTITARQRLMELKNQYSALIIAYSNSHPDIVRLKEEIAVAEKIINDGSVKINSDEATNPAYRQLKSRISATEKELERVADRRAKLEKDLADYNQRVIRTHQVKRNYDEMTRDYENKLKKYQDLRAKQLEANIAQNMEAENKAGSFKLIEPPSMPEKPVKPNRFKILLMGFVLSFGAGIGLMLAAEFFHSGVRGVTNISNVLGQQPLVLIQHVYNSDDDQLRTEHRKKFAYISVVFCMLSVVFFHYFILGLDTLWAKLMIKLNVM